MPFITDRRRRAGRYLEWKVGLFSVAAVLGLVGISLEERWMTGGAIVVLLAAMLVRFLPGARAGVDAEDDDDEGSDEGHEGSVDDGQREGYEGGQREV